MIRHLKSYKESVFTAPTDQIERNYRWNFLVNALDGASFWFGMSFISSTIILPLYVSRFTDNPLLIGLIPFLTTAGFLLPQIFVANAVERAPRKKFFPATLGFFLERLPRQYLSRAGRDSCAFNGWLVGRSHQLSGDVYSCGDHGDD